MAPVLPPCTSNLLLPVLHRATCKSVVPAANQRRRRERRGGIERCPPLLPDCGDTGISPGPARCLSRRVVGSEVRDTQGEPGRSASAPHPRCSAVCCRDSGARHGQGRWGPPASRGRGGGRRSAPVPRAESPGDRALPWRRAPRAAACSYPPGARGRAGGGQRWGGQAADRSFS